MQHLLLRAQPAQPTETSIVVGAGALDALAITVQDASLVLAVADRALAGGPAGEAVRGRLGGNARLFVIDGSERGKSIAAASALWDAWLEEGAGRDSVVVAVGGGVITDTTGFAAACYMRGVAWVAVPTTVMGMADAAIGGKTAVNASRGKNLVGAVHAPRAVLADVGLLATLDEEAYRDGWAEVVKAAVIADAPLLTELADAAPRILARDGEAVEDALVRAIRVKVGVVERDPFERSAREILNFGHTVAHALEHATAHELSHGRAVAAGMVAEAVLAAGMGRLPNDGAERIATACGALGIPWRAPEGLDEEKLLEAFAVDKKRRGNRLRVALPDGMGSHSDAPGVEVEPADLIAALHSATRLAS